MKSLPDMKSDTFIFVQERNIFMKKTLSLFMAIMAVSASQAATVLQPDFNYNGYWVYVWNGGDNGNWSENNWGCP